MTGKSRISTILSYSIPTTISMLLSTAVTLTDGYFVGNHVSEGALAAINLGLPILYLFLGVGLCGGVGGSVIAGHLIGKCDDERASGVFIQNVVTSLIMCIATSVAVYLLFAPILTLLRADGELSLFFTDYYRIMVFTYPVLVLNTIAGIFIRTDSKPQIYMLSRWQAVC